MNSSDGPRRVGAPMKIEGPLQELANAMGGVTALAEHLGVDPSTIWKWANEKSDPGDLVKRVVNRMCRMRKIADAFEGAGVID